MRTLIVASLLLPIALQGDRPLRAEQWQEDLAYFARELPKRHKNAFHTMSRDAFDSAVRRLNEEIPRLEAHAIPVRLLQITAQVGDGHTYARLPATFRQLPISLSFFGDTLRVAGVASETSELFGAEVVAIEGKPIAMVSDRVSTLLSRGENQWFERANLPGYLSLTEVLHALGISSAPDRAEIAFSVGGAEVRRMLIGRAREQLKFIPPAGPLPLYRQRLGDRFWFESLPGTQAGLYVAFRGYDDFGRNVRGLLSVLDTKRPSFVVFDLRQNAGGDFTKPREDLLPALKSRGYTGQRVYVITGRRTFSAAMVNAIDFRNVLQATLVGEPPGERPNSYQENDDMQLPHSKLVVSYSTKYYKFLDEDVPAVMPDQLIELTWDDFAAGRDPALDWILDRRSPSAASMAASSSPTPYRSRDWLRAARGSDSGPRHLRRVNRRPPA